MIDPFQHSREESRFVADDMGLDVAQVIGVSYEDHTIAVRPITKTADETDTTGDSSTVTISERGNVSLPSVGDLVVLASFKGETPIVLGTYYTNTTQIPTAEEGERVISHEASDSQVRLKPNGDVEIQPEGDVIVNGGGKKVVTDVTASGTNSEGGITGLNIERSDKVDSSTQ